MPPAVQTNSFLLQSGLYLKLPWWQQCVPVSSVHPHIRPVPLMQAFHSNEAFYQNSPHRCSGKPARAHTPSA